MTFYAAMRNARFSASRRQHARSYPLSACSFSGLYCGRPDNPDTERIYRPRSRRQSSHAIATGHSRCQWHSTLVYDEVALAPNLPQSGECGPVRSPPMGSDTGPNLKGTIAEELKRRGIELPTAQLDEFVRASWAILEASMPTIARLQPIAAQFRSLISRMLSLASKFGHIKALKQTLSPPIKKRCLFKFDISHPPLSRPRHPTRRLNAALSTERRTKVQAIF